MLLLDSLKIGAREITLHKMRSALTMLGVIFGVAAVISTAAISEGARAEIQSQLATLGTNTVRVKSVDLAGPDRGPALRKSPKGLTRADAAAVREVIPVVSKAAASKKLANATVFSEGHVVPADVLGVTEDLFAILGRPLASGRFLTPLDAEEARQVCVIGEEIRRAAYPLDSGLGKPLLLSGKYFTIVGVLKPRGKTAGSVVVETTNLDRTVFIPLGAALRRLAGSDPRNERLDEIVFQVEGEDYLRETASVIKRILSRRHNQVRDFDVIVPEELIRQQQKTKSVFGQVLVFIAAISLLVGGIGIMNIMLATVTQRTREIGVRRALGATRRDILTQFIVESLLISLLGGFIGIGIGYGLATGISRWSHWETIVPLQSVFISVAVAGAVGFAFGLYPSMQAARLDPIEALRSE